MNEEDMIVPHDLSPTNAWEGACAAAKISALRFHDLRHTFATRLRARGVHEMDIMSLLGHTTLQMTSRYTHAMPSNLREALTH